MKKLSLLLFFALIASAFAAAQTVEMTYHFSNPTFTEIQGYEQLQLEGCMQSALAGQPSLPWKSVSLMLPEDQEAESIEVTLSDFLVMEGSHQLFPYQPSRRYSDPERHEFLKDEALYASKALYPSAAEGHLSTQYMNGVGFAFSSFSPVQYEPATGQVRLATTATVKVRTKASKADHSRQLWLTPTNRARIQQLAQNPEMLQTYNRRGREVPGYELLVITTSAFVNQFDAYVNFYQARGLRTRVVLLDDIYLSMSGRDNQEKIRNYIIQEYQDNGIMMVNLGGDVPDIPFRGFYCYVTSGGGNQVDHGIPADLYYAGLDGTWNDNNNGDWGEPGEDDLLPEIGIGRMCFSSQGDFDNMMHKTMTYQSEPVLGEFRKVIMGGEHLYDDPVSNGSQYLELLIGARDDNGYSTVGIPEDYNFTRLYEEQGTWSGSLLRNAINQGTQYVHHDGHANTTYVAGWYNSDITDSNFANANGVDHNYTFFHTSGCICGDFSDNCILEKMTKISNFAVATIGNSRYGWFNEGQTEGPAIHLHRETEDAYYHERIPYSGLALSEAKCQTAPWVTAPGQWEEGALRWNFYDLNLMGDVAVSPWHDEPFTPEIDYQTQLIVGTQNTTVTVTDNNGNGLLNFRCCYFHGDEMIAFATTDENGVAEVTFDPAIDFVDDITLIVTGCDAWPQSLELISMPGNCAYVIYQSYEIDDNGNGQADYGENLSLNMEVKNVGTVAAGTVTATLSTESEYVTITNPTATINGVAGNQTVSLNDVFAMSISDAVPDMTNAQFILSCTDGTDTWISKFNMKLHAPQLAISSITGGESINPGETVTLHFAGINNGSSTATGTQFELFNSLSEITLTNSQHTIGTLEAGQEFTCDVILSLSDNAEPGVAYQLPYVVYTGNYITAGDFSFSVGEVMEGFESGDLSSFNWNTNSYINPWRVVTEDPYEGNYCCRSGSIDDSQEVTLSIELEVFSEGEVSFYKKVSSENNYDKLYFYIDNMEKGNWSGEVSWSRQSYTLIPGIHNLQWTYKKDFMMVSGQDCAWIDNIQFPPTHVITKVEETVSNTLGLYPNPNKGQFTLELGEESCAVTVINSLGQRVYQRDGLSGKAELNLHLTPGLYFVNIKSDHLNHTQKIVVE